VATRPHRRGYAYGVLRLGSPDTHSADCNPIYSELNADPIYYFRHVDVQVDNGVAHLSGFVWSADAIYQARKIALKVPGVTGVSTTHLELERNGRSGGSGPAR
jgi:hypothetical protein